MYHIHACIVAMATNRYIETLFIEITELASSVKKLMQNQVLGHLPPTLYSWIGQWLDESPFPRDSLKIKKEEEKKNSGSILVDQKTRVQYMQHMGLFSTKPRYCSNRVTVQTAYCSRVLLTRTVDWWCGAILSVQTVFNPMAMIYSMYL